MKNMNWFLTDVVFISSIGSKIVKLGEYFGKMRQLFDILAVRTSKKHKIQSYKQQTSIFLKMEHSIVTTR